MWHQVSHHKRQAFGLATIVGFKDFSSNLWNSFCKFCTVSSCPFIFPLTSSMAFVTFSCKVSILFSISLFSSLFTQSSFCCWSLSWLFMQSNLLSWLIVHFCFPQYIDKFFVFNTIEDFFVVYKTQERILFTSRQFCITTWIPNSASHVPIPDMKPNWLELSFRSNLLYILLCSAFNNNLRVWFLRLISLWPLYLLAFTFWGSGINVDLTNLCRSNPYRIFFYTGCNI